MGNAYVVGAGMSKFSAKSADYYDTLGRKAVIDAIKDAGISHKDIQAAFVGNMFSQTAGQRVCATLGLTGIPIVNVESACSSGAMAVNAAAYKVATGEYDLVLAAGVEHLSSLRTGGTAFAPDVRDPECMQGVTMPGLYAMRAKRYMHEYGATPEDYALVAVKNRRHASMNPYAAYNKPITVEEVLNSRMINDPLTLLMCSPNGDGAGAVVVASEKKMKQLGKKPVRIAASHITSGIFKNSFRDMTEMEISIRCSKDAYEEAGLGPEDISMVECHDAFSIAEFLYYEAFGFCKHGEAPQFIRSGGPDYGGKVVFSPRGGLMSMSHPTGASGCAQIVEATWQLRGEAGERQVPNCKAALTHVTGGGVYGLDNAACTVTILTI
jgi:benzoylsuccinyl-CoA thiolase BbsB subunit